MLITAVPIVEENTYIITIEYSPLVGGFAIVLNDGRAAFLTASSLRFDPNVNTYMIYACCIHENHSCCLFYFIASTRNLGTRHRRRDLCECQSQIPVDNIRTCKVCVKLAFITNINVQFD